MKMFNVGDRVKVVKENPWVEIGQIGTVEEECGQPRVNFDNDYPFYMWTEYLELLNPIGRNQIHITTKDTTTIAVLTDGKKEIRRAVAKCSPSDQFDFEVGAKLAFARLISGVFIGGVDMAAKEEKEELAKENNERIELLCIKDERPGEWLTKGKTYIFENGTLMYDDGFQPGPIKPYERWRKLNPRFSECLIIKPKAEAIPPTSFDWESFKQGKIAVNCDMEEKAKEFLKECELHEIDWCSGVKATKNNPGHVSYCCYHAPSKLEWCTKKFYEDEGKQIINYPFRPQYKEVKRVAKVGEWVKVVDVYSDLANEYKNGDVLKIINVDGGYPYYKNGIGKFLKHSEYVVLENYAPSTPIQSNPHPLNLSTLSDTELIAEFQRRLEKRG